MALCTQVIQEFLNATQKFEVPLKFEDCIIYLHKVLYPLCHVTPDLALYETCLLIQAETHYSFYDALILASAVHGGCEILYSEDFQDGQQVRGIQIINPF
jgi:predicted nucleic acid-binding protein